MLIILIDFTLPVYSYFIVEKTKTEPTSLRDIFVPIR